VREQVFRRLWDWIRNGRLKPGDRLRIQELARQLNVSDTPVREALIRLQQSGIVQTVPWAGARIKEFTREDIEEAYEVRQALESFAIRKVLTGDTPKEEFTVLRAAFTKAEAALRKGNSGPAIAAEMDLQAALARWTGNRQMRTLLTNARDQILVFEGVAARADERTPGSFRAHTRIVDALCANDAENAIRLLDEQLRAAKTRTVLAYFGKASA
jgi:DNA-binding GntR family transcriptional regulator